MGSMVIVTVKRKDEAAVKDLEVSPDLPIEQLSSCIAKAMNWDLGVDGNPILYDIEAHPPGRILQKNETLAQVNAWDGTWLILQPRNAYDQMQGMNAQFGAAQKQNSQDQEPAGNNGKFVWKRIDDDDS